jgi:hypothetical protein
MPMISHSDNNSTASTRRWPASIRATKVWLLPTRRASSACRMPACLRAAISNSTSLRWRLVAIVSTPAVYAEMAFMPISGDLKMAWVYCHSACAGCDRIFSYNPLRVPSLVIRGSREPICLDCVERVNPIRISNGLEPIVPYADAYEAIDYSELPLDD